jgi:hypothetical protein
MIASGKPYLRLSRSLAYQNKIDAFQVYQAVTGAVPDEATGLLTLTPEQFSSLQSLFFNIGGV